MTGQAPRLAQLGGGLADVQIARAGSRVAWLIARWNAATVSRVLLREHCGGEPPGQRQALGLPAAERVEHRLRAEILLGRGDERFRMHPDVDPMAAQRGHAVPGVHDGEVDAGRIDFVGARHAS